MVISLAAVVHPCRWSMING